MKSVLLIGLGRFGRHIALKLNEMNHQVMAVDINEDRVNAVLPYTTNAQIGDATREDFLETLGVNNFDVCIVAIGDDFQSSLETTSLLKELGAKWLLKEVVDTDKLEDSIAAGEVDGSKFADCIDKKETLAVKFVKGKKKDA